MRHFKKQKSTDQVRRMARRSPRLASKPGKLSISGREELLLDTEESDGKFAMPKRQSPRLAIKPSKLTKLARKKMLLDIGGSDNGKFATPKASAVKSFRGKSLYEDGNPDHHHDHSNNTSTSEPSTSSANDSYVQQQPNKDEGSGSDTTSGQATTDENILFDGTVIVTIPEFNIQPIPTGGATVEVHLPLQPAESAIAAIPEHTAGTSRDALPYSKRVKQKRGHFQCKTCLKMFAFKHNLTQHEFTHLPKECHQCDWCERTYDNVINLKQHKRRFPSKLQCSRCRFKCHKNLLPHDYCKKCPKVQCTFVTQTHTIHLKHQLQCIGEIQCPELSCPTIFSSTNYSNVRRHVLQMHNKYIV